MLYRMNLTTLYMTLEQKSILLVNYNNILHKMITPYYETRISSFYAIFREITSKNATFIRFSNNEKQIYGNIADLFMSVCSSIEYSTKYIDNIEVITKRLEQLVQKSLLEELVQNNC